MHWFERFLCWLLPVQDIFNKDGELYLRRFFIYNRDRGDKRSWHIYLHKFYRGDEDRHLHDHPWPFKSLILKGGYWEHRKNPAYERWRAEMLMNQSHPDYRDPSPAPPETIRTWYGPFSFLQRGARWAHKVELPVGKIAWTLVYTGVKERDWGFHTENGWCFWKKYDDGVCAAGDE